MTIPPGLLTKRARVVEIGLLLDLNKRWQAGVSAEIARLHTKLNSLRGEAEAMTEERAVLLTELREIQP